MSVRLAAALMLAVAAMAAPAVAPAIAHGPSHPGDARIRAVADPAPIAGLAVQAAHSLAPQLTLRNDSGHVVEILDDAGRAFLRIGPGGVEADFNAVAFYRTYSTAGLTPPLAAGADAPPAWSRIADEPSWGWFDPRLSEKAAGADAAALAAATKNARRSAGPVSFGTWSAPMLIDGAPSALTGRFEVAVGEAAVPEPTIERGPPQGWSARIAPGAHPALMLSRLGPEQKGPGADDAALTVIGIDGEPYLRLDRDGAAINPDSATWRRYGRIEGLEAPPRAAGAEGVAWMNVTATPRFAFIDPRLTGEGAPDGRWSIPIIVDGARSVIEGVTARAKKP